MDMLNYIEKLILTILVCTAILYCGISAFILGIILIVSKFYVIGIGALLNGIMGIVFGIAVLIELMQGDV